MIKINGKETNADGMTIAEYLRKAGYNISRVAVEKNSVIVPKLKYDNDILKDGDTLEIVGFVGGG